MLRVIEREEGFLRLQAETRVAVRQDAAARRPKRARRGRIERVEEIVDVLAEPFHALGPVAGIGQRRGEHLQLQGLYFFT